MRVTELGIVISVRLTQPAKACSPMVVTELGMEMFVSPRHTANALSPMVVTELETVTLVRFLQP